MFWRRKPDPLADLAAASGTLFHASAVPIRASAKDFKIPGRNQVPSAVRRHRGSAVVTADHLTVTFRTFTAINSATHDDPSAPVQVSYAADGIHIAIDVTAALRTAPGSNRGTAEIFVQAPIPTDVLAKLRPQAIKIGVAQVSAITRRI